MKPQHLKYSTLAMCLSCTSAIAQDDSSQQILQLLQGINDKLEGIATEQEALRSDVDALKASQETPAAEAVEKEEAIAEASTTAPIRRESGWIASIHPADSRGRGLDKTAIMGRMVIDGFPMSYAELLDINSSSNPKGYTGNGEIFIKEDGTHSFTLQISSNGRIYPKCTYTMHIGGREIFNTSTGQIKPQTSTSEAKGIGLSAGFYDWEISQFCGNVSTSAYDAIIWDLQILTPNAMNAVSVGSDYISHRVAQ